MDFAVVFTVFIYANNLSDKNCTVAGSFIGKHRKKQNPNEYKFMYVQNKKVCTPHNSTSLDFTEKIEKRA